MSSYDETRSGTGCGLRKPRKIRKRSDKRTDHRVRQVSPTSCQAQDQYFITISNEYASGAKRKLDPNTLSEPQAEVPAQSGLQSVVAEDMEAEAEAEEEKLDYVEDDDDLFGPTQSEDEAHLPTPSALANLSHNINSEVSSRLHQGLNSIVMWSFNAKEWSGLHSTYQILKRFAPCYLQGTSNKCDGDLYQRMFMVSSTLLNMLHGNPFVCHPNVAIGPVERTFLLCADHPFVALAMLYVSCTGDCQLQLLKHFKDGFETDAQYQQYRKQGQAWLKRNKNVWDMPAFHPFHHAQGSQSSLSFAEALKLSFQL